MVKAREKWIDLAKGIAIILVVTGHVVTSFHNAGLLLEAKAFNFVGDFAYSFHMPLFFILSGYLSSGLKDGETLRKAIMKKVISYGVPYLVFSVLVFILKSFAGSVVNTQITLYDLGMIFIYPISSLWFIYALLFISVISLVIKQIKVHPYTVLLIGLGLKFGAYLLLQLNNLVDDKVFQCVFYDVCRFFFWYALGECMKQFITNEKTRMVEMSWKLIGSICTIFAVITWITSFSRVESFMLDLFFGLCGSILCIICSLKISENKLLEYLGRYSLPIYLLHGYVISALRVVLKSLRTPLLDGFVPLVLGTVLAIGLSLLVYEISTKIKWLDFCFYPSRYIKLK